MNETVYKSKSIINIKSNSFTVNEGTVTRLSSGLKFLANSRCTFRYDYNEKPLSSSKLKVTYKLTIFNNNSLSRYNNNIQINLKIQYYNSDYDSNYTDGNIENVRIIPYLHDDNVGDYTFEEIDLKSNYIKYIEVSIAYYNSNSNNDYMLLTNLGIYSTVIGSEEQIRDTIEQTFNEYITNYPEQFDDAIHDYIEHNPENIEDIIEQYLRDHPFCLPLETSLPPIATTPDGYIFRYDEGNNT